MKLKRMMPVATAHGGPSAPTVRDPVWKKIEVEYGKKLSCKVREKIVAATKDYIYWASLELSAPPSAEYEVLAELLIKHSEDLLSTLQRLSGRDNGTRWLKSEIEAKLDPQGATAEPACLAGNVQIDVARRAGGRHGERQSRGKPLLHAGLAATHRDHNVRHMGVACKCPDEAPMGEGKLHAKNADRSRFPWLDKRTVAPSRAFGASLSLRTMIVSDRGKPTRIVTRHHCIEGARAELVWRALAACVRREGTPHQVQLPPRCRP